MNMKTAEAKINISGSKNGIPGYPSSRTLLPDLLPEARSIGKAGIEWESEFSQVKAQLRGSPGAIRETLTAIRSLDKLLKEIEDPDRPLPITMAERKRCATLLERVLPYLEEDQYHLRAGHTLTGSSLSKSTCDLIVDQTKRAVNDLRNQNLSLTPVRGSVERGTGEQASGNIGAVYHNLSNFLPSSKQK